MRVYPACFLLIVFLLLPVSLFSQQTKIGNEYIAVNYEPTTGRFAIVNVKGDPVFPSDDNRNITGGLLGTFALLKIDDKYYKFGDTAGKMLSRTIQADRSEHVWQIQNIDIKQEIQLRHSPYTVYPYNVNIRYWIKNTDKVQHKVGIRVILDTFVGLDDAISFYIPEMQPVERELELNTAQIPDFFCAWDNISGPASRLIMNYIGKEVCKPDFLMFANKKRLASVMWELAPEPGKGFRANPVEPSDTAVSMRWEPITFNPGYENGIAFDYGLGSSSFNARITPFEVLSFAPQRNPLNNEFWILGQAHNSDAQRSIKNVKFQLELPPELKLVSGAIDPVISSSLEPQKSQLYYWRVKATKTGSFDFKLKVTGLYNNEPAISMTPNKIVIE